MWPMRNLSWMLVHAHTANVHNNNGLRFFRWCVLSDVYCCYNKLHSSCKHRFILHWKGLKYFFRFYQKWKIRMFLVSWPDRQIHFFKFLSPFSKTLLLFLTTSSFTWSYVIYCSLISTKFLSQQQSHQLFNEIYNYFLLAYNIHTTIRQEEFAMTRVP